jgi:hypothetical protein
MARWLRTSAAVGAVAWVALWFVGLGSTDETLLIERLFLLAPLVTVPLGLALSAAPDRRGRTGWAFRSAGVLQGPAAAALIVSFRLAAGARAELFAVPWALVTFLVALHGATRLLPRGTVALEETCIDAGLLYLPIGGVWLLYARLGAQPLGFGTTIVLLTAVHFHFAGFAAPIIAGVAGRVVGHAPRGLRRAYQISAWSVIAGPPLLAVGITVSPLMEIVTALVLAGGLLVLSVLGATRIAPAVRHRAATPLLMIASASLVVTMAAACTYALGEFLGRALVTIPQMALVHGVANALGFSLCGLLAWTVAAVPARVPAPGIPFSRLSAGWRVGADFFDRIGERAGAGGPAPVGLIDKLDDYGHAGFDAAAVHPAVRAFYERTSEHRLVVQARWARGFRAAGTLFHRFAGWLGQLQLPAGDDRTLGLESALLALGGGRDGRPGVRAWVRRYADTKRPIYVAAYSRHVMVGVPYMNVAFPLPGGNMTSVLLFENAPEAGAGALALGSLDTPEAHGDQGIYFANRILPVRLPFDERIVLWAEEEPEPRVRARHDMWLLGVKFLVLDYTIVRENSGA